MLEPLQEGKSVGSDLDLTDHAIARCGRAEDLAVFEIDEHCLTDEVRLLGRVLEADDQEAIVRRNGCDTKVQLLPRALQRSNRTRRVEGRHVKLLRRRVHLSEVREIGREITEVSPFGEVESARGQALNRVGAAEVLIKLSVE